MTTEGPVEIVEVRSRRDREDFIRLPGRLAAGDPAWVEPLHFERRQFLDPRHNPVFEHSRVRLWLARRGGRAVGRLSAQIDELAPPAEGRRVGFFGMPDARDDAALAALFETAEAWLRAEGAEVARGPFGLSVNQVSGLLVDGFEEPPSVMMDHHAPWLGPAVERRGYAKARDLLAYRVDPAGRFPAAMRRAAERAGHDIAVRPLDPRRFEAEIHAVTEVFNDAWSDNWGFVPMTEAEIAAMAKELRPILPPDFVRIAERDGRAVGFSVMLPNVNEAAADLGGRLLPFGWARLLWRLKVSGVRSARVPLMGVRREVSGTPAGKLLPIRLIDALHGPALKRGVREIEMSWLLEENRGVRRLVEALGSRLAKTYRIYEKRL